MRPPIIIWFLYTKKKALMPFSIGNTKHITYSTDIISTSNNYSRMSKNKIYLKMTEHTDYIALCSYHRMPFRKPIWNVCLQRTKKN